MNVSFEQMQYSVKEIQQFVTLCISVFGNYEISLKLIISASSNSSETDNDFMLCNTSILISPAEVENCFNITIAQDNVVESNEKFYVALESDNTAIKTGSPAAVEIIDSTVLTFAFNHNVYMVTEGMELNICISTAGRLNRSLEILVISYSQGK